MNQDAMSLAGHGESLGHVGGGSGDVGEILLDQGGEALHGRGEEVREIVVYGIRNRAESAAGVRLRQGGKDRVELA